MTDSPADSGGSAQNGSEQQALTQVEGIGEVKRQWLESIGIETLQDLANADAEVIESELAASDHPTSRNVIDNWIAQAQRLVEITEAKEPSETETASEEASPASPQASSPEPEQPGTDESSEVSSDAEEDEIDEGLAATEEDSEEDSEEGEVEDATETTESEAPWETFASFTVAFESKQINDQIQYQTSARHLETDQIETWSDIDEEKLQAWLRRQLAAAVPSPEAPTVAKTLDMETWFTPLVRDLRIYQPPSSTMAMEIYKPNLMFPSPVKSNLPFTLELEFSIQEQEVFSRVEEEVLYEAECYARSLMKGEVLSLGKIPPTPLVDKKDSYPIQFSAANLQPGFYRVQFLLNLRGIHAFPLFFEVPALQVA